MKKMKWMKLKKKKKKRRAEGVMYDDYTYLANRIDTMETSISSIISKIDQVLKKIDRENNIKGSNIDFRANSRAQSGKSRIGSARPPESNC